MRPYLLAAALFLVAASAGATPGPAPELKLTPSASEYAIAMEARGAMLESDYFNAPSQRFTSGAACRMFFDPFEKDRLAAICR
jgi:hypothetical protein